MPIFEKWFDTDDVPTKRYTRQDLEDLFGEDAQILEVDVEADEWLCPSSPTEEG